MIEFFNERGDTWMNDMIVLALKTGMRKGEIIALGEGRASISECGDWIYLPADVTKTSEARYVPISNPVARDCAVRIVRDLASQYTKKRFEHRWMLLKREYARNDDTYVFHVTRHNAASKMANELQVPTVIVAEMMGHKVSRQHNDMFMPNHKHCVTSVCRCDVTVYHLSIGRSSGRPFFRLTICSGFVLHC